MPPAGVVGDESPEDREVVSSGGASAEEGVYGIGAVAAMVGVPAATLRTWEERYGTIVPERTPGGHRLYSRSQVQQLQFIVAEMARGASAADAYRALARARFTQTERLGAMQAGARVLILVAERDEYTAELIEFLLRTEGYAVEVTLDADEAKRRFELTRANLVIVEFLLGGDEGETLCHWLKEHGAWSILVLSELDAADRALRAGADAFLRKPVGHLRLVSTVKDLLRASALLHREDDP
jgi:DNA-binding transcriptional MerR regulator